MHYIRNENGRYTHSDVYLTDRGPRYYNHSLAKEMWKIGSITDFVEQNKAYRFVGWKIAIHGTKLSKGNETEIFRCMQMFYYLHQHVLCGNDVFPGDKPMAHFAVASKIEHSWDGIMSWVA